MVLRKIDLSNGSGGKRDRFYIAPNGVTVTATQEPYVNGDYYYLGYIVSSNMTRYYMSKSLKEVDIIFDFNTIKNPRIKRIDIIGKGRTDHNSYYSVSISKDGMNYEQIIPKTLDSTYNHWNSFNVDTKGYRYLKVRVEKYSGQYYAILGKIEFYYDDNYVKQIIKDGSKYKKIENGVLKVVGDESTELTRSFFELNGMDDVFSISEANWNQMESDEIEILTLDKVVVSSEKAYVQFVPTEQIAIFNYDYENVDEIEIVDYETVDIIPEMISYTSPSGEAKASSEKSIVYSSFRAFDKQTSLEWVALRSLSQEEAWLSYTFPIDTLIYGYEITIWNYSYVVDGQPTSWVFEALDNDRWVVLDEVIDFPAQKTSYSHRHEIKAQKSYSSYRIRILNTLVENTPPAITEFKILKKQYFKGDRKVAYSYDSGLTWKGNVDIDINNRKDFLLNGIDVPDFIKKFPDIKNNSDTGKVRLAILLNKKSYTDSNYIKNITLKKKIYNITPILQDIKIIKNTTKDMNEPEIFIKTDGLTWNKININQLNEIKSDASENIQIKLKIKNGKEIYAICYSWI